MLLTQSIYREIQQTYLYINLSVVTFNVPLETESKWRRAHSEEAAGLLAQRSRIKQSHLRWEKTLMWFCLDMKSTQRQMTWPSYWSRLRDWSWEADQTGRNLPDWRLFYFCLANSLLKETTVTVFQSLALLPALIKKKEKVEHLFGTVVFNAFAVCKSSAVLHFQ